MLGFGLSSLMNILSAAGMFQSQHKSACPMSPEPPVSSSSPSGPMSSSSVTSSPPTPPPPPAPRHSVIWEKKKVKIVTGKITFSSEGITLSPFQPKEELFINISKLSLSSSPLNQRSYLDTRKSHRHDICGGYYRCQTDGMPKENCLKRILNRNRRKSIKG